MANFKVGDRVRAIKDYDGNDHIVNQTGTVIVGGVHHAGVEFDKAVNGHDCGGRGKHNYCWWCTNDVLEPVAANEKIVITSDGKTTLARLYNGKRVVKTAKAACAPDDAFDFETGAKIAFERLVGKFTETVSFKKGDRVRIIANTSGHNFQIGSVVTIVGNDAWPADQRKCKGLDLDNKVNWWWVKESDMEPVNFDWAKFEAGKIAVKATEDNFENFVAEAKKHKLTFNPDEDFNPFNALGDKLFRAILLHIDVKENEIYVMCEDGALKISHCLKELEEFVW